MKNFPLILFYFLLCLYSVRESKASPSFPKDHYSVRSSGKVKTWSVTEQHTVPAHLVAKADESFSVQGFMEPELLVLLLLIMLLGMLHGRQPG